MAGFVISRFFVLVTLVFLGGCLQGETATFVVPAHLQAQSIGVMDRFSPFEPVKGTGQVDIFAARNEYEGFQFVVTAGERGAVGVDVSVSSLRNAAGDELPVQVFRERYVRVSQSSPFSPYAPQAWPDILLPAKETVGQAAEFRAFPQDLASGENMPVWVDVHVPGQAAPGNYTGVVRVMAQNGESAELPVSLTVWDFALPERLPFRTVFGTNGFRVAEVYGFDVDNPSAENNQVIRAYNDFLLDHYLSPESFLDAIPKRDEHDRPGFDKVFAGLGTVTENMRHYMQDKHASVYTYEFGDTYPFDKVLGENHSKALKFMAEYADWCERLAGEARRCYTNPSFLDEPNSAEAYASIRRWGKFFDEAAALARRPIRFQVSEQPSPDDPSWGNLYGSVDVWVSHVVELWRDMDNSRDSVTRQRLAAGDEVWGYTSVVLNMDDYRRENPAADPLRGNYPPVWQMDYPPVNYRIPAWLFHRYGLSGFGYWETFAWFDGADVWNDAGNYRTYDGVLLNGDGLLVYPGRKSEVGFDGPIPSLRLQWVRDSFEDYMYIHLLLAAHEDEFVRQQVGQIARNLGDWDNNPALLMQIRQALGERLSALSAQAGGRRP